MIFNLICDAAAFMEGMDRAIHGVDEIDKGMQKLEKNTSFLNRTLSTFVANLGVKVVEAATRAFGTLKQGFDQFANFAKGATLEAARIEVQWRTLSMTGAKMGATFGEIEESIGGLRAAGIKTSEALQVMTQWLSAGLPADKLKELSRAAQDLAVTLGTDSTQAMERFNWFVQTGNSELLRTVGIMQTSTQMEERFAQSIGKTREQLTDQERRLARVNGLLEATATYAGAYEQALSDPFKRMTSLAREFSNVVEVIGAIFVPLLGTAVDIASDALEKIERLFRVTKKESKESGRAIGEWKEGFLKLRAVVTAFANWFTSIWERLTSDFGSKAEGMMDRFVNAIIRGVKAAADALRRFACFIAGIFGGRAPGEITAGAVAATKPAPGPEAPRREAPPAGPPVEIMAEPQKAAKLRAKPVEPAAAEDVARYNELMGKLVGWNQKLAAATAAVAKARNVFAKAEERLEKASEKVYDIRRKIAKLELAWAEIPERFIRGRKRQLQMELMAAEHEEHERKKEADAAQERLQVAEKYQREVEQMTESLQREAERLGESIAQQNEKYQEWLGSLQEAEQVRLEEPIQAIVNEFESLDDLTAGYLEEIEGELMPAFASIEESVKSIGSSVGEAWDKAKGFVSDLLTGTGEWGEKLGPVKAIFQWIWDTVRKIYEKITEALEVYRQIKAIAEVGMPGGAAGAPMLAGEEESLYERFSGWLQAMREEKPEVEETAEESFFEPVVNVFNRLYDAIAGRSIVPDMIRDILAVFQRLADDVVGPLTQFTDFSIEDFHRLTESWLLDIGDLGRELNRLTGWFETLGKAMKGLDPMPESLKLAANGNFRVVTVNLQGSTFGAGVDEWEVKGWIYDAMRDVVD